MSAECIAENIPPGYKQTEVGVIPEDWEVDSLINFWNVMDCKHVTAHFVANGFPIASIMEVQSRFVDLNNAKQTTQQFYSLLIEGGRRPNVGDLILSRNATVGEVAQVAEWHPLFAMGQDVCLLRKKSLEFSTNYLQAVFHSSIIRSQLLDLMVGSTFKRANVQQIKSFIVPMPSPAEQEAIAEALSDMDAFIESLEQLIAKKRQIKQGAMQELLTGKRRLPGFEINIGYKQTDVGVIPEDWNAEALGPNVDIKSGESPSLFRFESDGVPYFKVEQLNNNNKYLQNTPYFFQGVKKVARGSLIFPKRGASILLNKIRILEKDSFMDTNLMTLTPKETLHNEFLYYALTYTELWRIADTTSIPQINNKHIIPLVVALPSLSEQHAIATILSEMDSEITALEEKLAKARQIKQGMMQELLTGKIRLI